MRNSLVTDWFRTILWLACPLLIYGTFSHTSSYATSSTRTVPSVNLSKEGQPKSASTSLPLPQPPEVYQTIARQTGIQWTWLAAVDQYEQTIRPKGSTMALLYNEQQWSGMYGLFRSENEQPTTDVSSLSNLSVLTTKQFHGAAADGDEDGMADLNNPYDRMTALANQLLGSGKTVDDLHIALWERYQLARSVQRIIQFESLYSSVPLEKLASRAFPIQRVSEATYKDTWGNARGWGGKRTHEGTDLFARKGVTVQSTCYGVVELIGWNPYGGWRIGIRDIHNVYHYFAHLHGFAKGLRVNMHVAPGEIIGSVGNSGYGKPGTTGKFPPHLHYGMYRDRGQVEWAFNPYPSLRQWEKSARSRSTAERRRQSSKR